MGLYDVLMVMSLFGFGIGMIFAIFHVCGMMLLFMLYMLVRYASPNGPMFLRCLMWPCGVVVFLCFIAAWTCVVVSVIFVVCSLCVFLSMCPFCVFYV